VIRRFKRLKPARIQSNAAAATASAVAAGATPDRGSHICLTRMLFCALHLVKTFVHVAPNNAFMPNIQWLKNIREKITTDTAVFLCQGQDVYIVRTGLDNDDIMYNEVRFINSKKKNQIVLADGVKFKFGPDGRSASLGGIAASSGLMTNTSAHPPPAAVPAHASNSSAQSTKTLKESTAGIRKATARGTPATAPRKNTPAPDHPAAPVCLTRLRPLLKKQPPPARATPPTATLPPQSASSVRPRATRNLLSSGLSSSPRPPNPTSPASPSPKANPKPAAPSIHKVHIRKGRHAICEHNKRRTLCTVCGGNSLCVHKHQKAHCKLCRPKSNKSFCKHNKQRSRCVACRGVGICQHKRDRYRCKICKGAV
jgi:hypothetical protein